MAKDESVNEIVDELKKVQLELFLKIDSYEQLRKVLSEHLNYLITSDFSRLISILYRLDISEKKLKGFLSSSINTSAGDIIARMIIERQLQKIASRKAFENKADNIAEEDRW